MEHFGESFGLDELKQELKNAQLEDSKRFKAAARAVLLAGKGGTPFHEPIYIYSSDHIIGTIERKARQPRRANRPEDQGLGLGEAVVAEILDDFLIFLTNETGGRVVTFSEQTADKTPPLDFEDGMVFGLCNRLRGEDARNFIWCLTFDKRFIEDAKTFGDSSNIRVCPPEHFVSFIKSQTTQIIQKIIPRSSSS